ncbi:MAG: hypothetical protein GWN58_55475, partial [Anaerolineae bacterium]|nr:hypothetical protein [Anaerolineae bacterium]
KALNVSLKGSTLAILGPIGLVAALTAIIGVGVYSYLKELEEGHREEAAAILNASESYEEYVRQAEKAGLINYVVSEGLWEVARGANAAKEGVDALTVTEAWRELQKGFGFDLTGIEWLDDLLEGLPRLKADM